MFVKLTRFFQTEPQLGSEIWVNTDKVFSFERSASEKFTRIDYEPNEPVYLDVKETPEEILILAAD